MGKLVVRQSTLHITRREIVAADGKHAKIHKEWKAQKCAEKSVRIDVKSVVGVKCDAAATRQAAKTRDEESEEKVKPAG